MDYDSTLSKIEAYASDLLSASLNQLPYHNLGHTRYVVERATEIAHYYQLEPREVFILTAAAWMHDLGYANGQALGHEQRAIDLLHSLKKTLQLPESTVGPISRCILATRLPQHPTNLLDQILCDADLYHLGTEDFITCDANIWAEQQTWLQRPIPPVQWQKSTIDFLESHRYHTMYCQQLLSNRKAQNLEWLKDNWQAQRIE